MTIKIYKSGFSIAEVVITLFVIVVGIMGVIGLIVNSMKNSMESRDHIIGAALAQEGIELVRNIRDNNVLNSLDFNANLASATCIINYNYTLPLNCSVSDFKLKYDTASNLYSHASGDDTKFSRKIIFVNDDGIDNIIGTDDDFLSATSKVWWGGSEPAICNSVNKCITAGDILTKHP